LAGRKIIFYFYIRKTTFIEKDLKIFRKEAHVFEHHFPAPEKWKTSLLFLSQAIFLLAHLRHWSGAIAIMQFSGYHSFIPVLWARITGNKSIIVAGGTDCVSFPSLRYGHFHKKLLAWFTRQSYRMVSVVSAVHSCLFFRQDHYDSESESTQGILHFVPDARFERNVIPNGYDAQAFGISEKWEDRAEKSFITISASLDDPIRLKLKGVDLILDLAKLRPDCTFTLVGASEEQALKIPENVRLLPFLPNRELAALYNRHRFYLQLSISEGFPNALCEAMCCGCIPIVSAVASMPEIVAETGFILEKRDMAMLQKLLDGILESQILPEKSEKARQKISENYPLKIREEGLIKLIS
jgi:glycosyltransferase involved in cell wall biosynthesis